MKAAEVENLSQKFEELSSQEKPDDEIDSGFPGDLQFKTGKVHQKSGSSSQNFLPDSSPDAEYQEPGSAENVQKFQHDPKLAPDCFNLWKKLESSEDESTEEEFSEIDSGFTGDDRILKAAGFFIQRSLL